LLVIGLYSRKVKEVGFSLEEEEVVVVVAAAAVVVVVLRLRDTSQISVTRKTNF